MDVKKISRYRYATWNIRGLGEREGELDKIQNENNIKISVITESKKKLQGTKETEHCAVTGEPAKWTAQIQMNNSSRNGMHENNSRIHSVYKTNSQIAKELNITPILDILLEYKRNWIQYVNRMSRNRLTRVMKRYSPTGIRNHGRHLKRLLDT